MTIVLCHELRVFGNVLSIVLTGIKYAVCNKLLPFYGCNTACFLFYDGFCVNLVFCWYCISVWNVHCRIFISHPYYLYDCVVFSQIKMYNNNNVAMNLLPALASLLFCWMLCWWVIAQGPDQWPLKAGLLLVSYWPLDWPPFKASLWRQLLWFAKMYQEEILDLTCWQEMGVLVFLFF